MRFPPFGRRTRNRAARRPYALILGVGSGPSFTATEASDALARSILEHARGKAQGRRPGDAVDITVTGDHSDVNRWELAISLSQLGAEYGLRYVANLVGCFTFQKL